MYWICVFEVETVIEGWEPLIRRHVAVFYSKKSFDAFCIELQKNARVVSIVGYKADSVIEVK